jgi:plastocyanin
MKRTWGLMQRKRGTAVAATVAAVLLLPAVASAATKVVTAGPPPAAKGVVAKVLGKGAKAFFAKYNPDINAFFRQRVTINAGDKVSFIQDGFHTIDLPGKTNQPLPLILPSGGLVSGVNDAAGNPFWFNGKLPNVGLNPAVAPRSTGKTYNGSTRLDSGLPSNSGAPKPFVVKFTKPGVYKYFCDIHPGMVGFVVVKPKGKPVPSAKQDAAALVAQVTVAAKAAKKLANTRVPANHVSLGEAGANGIELFAMFPAQLTVKTGSVVTFSITRDSREVHTATFGPAKYINGLANGSPNGLFTAPGPTAQALFPSDPTPVIPLNPTSHGNGFANIGAVDSQNSTVTIPSSGQIQFTAPGVYHFICLIHPQEMHGTIIVK